MPYLPLTEDDARTFATRVLAFELTGAQRQVYVETLLCLLRDAYTQRNPAAVAFMRPFLDGLLPANVIAAHEQTLSAQLLATLPEAPATSPSPPMNGGLKVEAAVPPPTRPPATGAVHPIIADALKPFAPADRKPVQSSTLKW
jgi:hypothetical protein